MNIRPVDLQVLIPRITEVSKAQQASEQQPLLQQQQMAGDWRQISSRRQQQVQQTGQNEGGVIKDGYERQQKKDGRKHGKHHSHSPEAAEKTRQGDYTPTVCGHRVDIKT
ncbi:MAG: hypothetical protein N2491_00120 [Negativicutes bacterium]|nr:hypothetical protein [Negativicutes bacterium]